MSDYWVRQIERADELAAGASGSKELLRFYAQLLRAQQEIYEAFRSRRGFWLPSGDLETDLPVVQESMSGLLKRVVQSGPESLAEEAQALLDTESNEMAHDLLSYWRSPSDTQFFAKSVLQPYTRWLAENGIKPAGRELAGGERTCPFCGGLPQLSFLQSKESSESGNRDLLCATCLCSWEFRRVICASCGEERPAKLGYFHSPEFDHIRIEACDTCKHYLKGIDLTRLGLAVPLVDEIYSAPLDLWAREHGYTKIELNLIGL